MSARRNQKQEEPKVERVSLVDRVSGTFVTVGSNVAEKYLKTKRYREYDESRDARPDEDEELLADELGDGGDEPEVSTPEVPTPARPSPEVPTPARPSPAARQ